MVSCAIYGCKSNSSNRTSNQKLEGIKKRFLCFPKDTKLASLWIKATKRKDSFNLKTSRICSDHFLKSDFELSFRQEFLNCRVGPRLKKGAIPHVNLPNTKSDKIDENKRNERRRKRLQRELVNSLLQQNKQSEKTLEITQKLLENDREVISVKQLVDSPQNTTNEFNSDQQNKIDNNNDQKNQRKEGNLVQSNISSSNEENQVQISDKLKQAFKPRILKNSSVPQKTVIFKICDGNKNVNSQLKVTGSINLNKLESSQTQKPLTQNKVFLLTNVPKLNNVHDKIKLPQISTVPGLQNTVLLNVNVPSKPKQIESKATETKKVEKFVCNKPSRTNEEIIALLEVNKLKKANTDLNRTVQKQDHTILCLKKALSKIFTDTQIKVLENPHKRVNWNMDDIISSISLYSAGPRCYNVYRKRGYPYPGASTLRKWAKTIKLEPGICGVVLSLLKYSPLTKLEKVCVLSFDEMKIYETHEYTENNEECVYPEKEVQVVMCRGLFSEWRQPIFYEYDYTLTKYTLLKIISSLRSIEYRVAAVIFSLKKSHQDLCKDLEISTEKTYFVNPLEPSLKIYAIVNPHSLIKSIHGYFVESGFIFPNGEMVDTKPIEMFLNLSCTNEIEIDHNLSTMHLTIQGTERQKLNTAVQFFSYNIAESLETCALLGYIDSVRNCNETANFIKQTNDWFSCMNCKELQKESSNQVKPFDVQKTILKEFSNVIETLRINGEENLAPFQKGVLITNKSLVCLFEEMKTKYNATHLVTSRLNQNALDNFFGHVRAIGRLRDPVKQLDFQKCLRSYLFGKNYGNMIISNSENENMSLYVDDDNETEANVSNEELFENNNFKRKRKKLNKNTIIKNLKNKRKKNVKNNQSLLLTESTGGGVVKNKTVRRQRKKIPKNNKPVLQQNSNIQLTDQQIITDETWLNNGFICFQNTDA